MESRVHDLFSVPMVDLNARDRALSGIWMPKGDSLDQPPGVTEQFLAENLSFHERYSDADYFRSVLEPVLKQIDLPDRPIALDLGSGSGNTVLATLELCPSAHVVATDISSDQLALLREVASSDPSYTERLTLVRGSAMTLPVRRAGFDLVIGGAILHHLIDPGAALIVAGTALAPERWALFLEPFENGNSILRLAYLELLERARWSQSRITHRAGFSVLKQMVLDVDRRRGRDKIGQEVEHLDDKWLFTRTLLQELADGAGFGELEISPLHDSRNPFSHQTEVNLRLAAGLE